MKKLKYLFIIFLAAHTANAQAPTNYGSASGTIGGGGTYIGHRAGSSNASDGYGNALFGAYSGAENIGGDHNCFIGTNAGRYSTDGSHNTFLGAAAGYSNTTGGYNVFLGRQAANDNTSGANNVVIGPQAGFTNKTGSGNIFIGYKAGYNETGHSKLYIDNSSTATPLIYGDFSNDALTINGTLRIGDATLPPDYQMSIDGKLIAEEVRVRPSDWWDEVFMENYDLMTIEEKEAFTKKNHHLPAVQPEATVVSEGMDLGKSYADLLKEIEEAHLYIFQLNEAIKASQKQAKETHLYIFQLNETVKALQSEVKTLKQSSNQ